jgi:hypothetical protein
VIDTKKSLELSVNFAVSFWAKPLKYHQIDMESNNQKCCVYSGGSGQNYIMYPAHGRLIWGNNDHAGMGISMGKNGVSIYEHRDYHLPAVLVWESPTEILDWTHIVVNYKNNKSHLYVNGKLVKEGLDSIQQFVHPSIGNPQSNINEGIGGGLNQYYNGYLDEFAIFSSTLTNNQINHLFSVGVNLQN